MTSRFLSLALLSVLIIPAASAADLVQLDSSEALFTVLAAANAAGYDGGLASSPDIRRQVRAQVEASRAAVIAELKAWYHEHPPTDKTQDLSRFISLGLSVKGAPNFEWAKREVEVPPDAKEMDAFREFLPAFYEQAGIAEIWESAQSAIQPQLERLQEPVASALLQANGYLRNPKAGYLGRRFTVFVDVLGAPNQIQNRSFGDDFFIVLTPSTDLHVFEIRHAYFRYLIDPLAIKYGMELERKAALMDIAEGAPLLREPYRSNFDLLATECLIKAIESRLLANPSLIDQAVREGYILTPFFNEQLALYEKDQDPMKLFFPRMVAALSVNREIKRLNGVQFAKELPTRSNPANQPAPEKVEQPAQSASAATVTKADQFYAQKDLEHSGKLYEQALTQPGSATDHARAFFGLAHVALLRNDPEKADQLFRKALDSSPDADVKAWSCYYLGKLYVLAKEQDEARKWFTEAVETNGAPAKAVESSRTELAELAKGSGSH